MNKLRNRLKHKFGLAVDWRVRDVLEAEREATVKLGQLFIDGAAQITDGLRLLELQVTELKRRVEELENRP